MNELEHEQNKGKELRDQQKQREELLDHWWEKPLEQLSLPQLSEYRNALELLKKDVEVEKYKLLNLNNYGGTTGAAAGASTSTSHGQAFGGFLPQIENNPANPNYPMPPPLPYNGYGGFN